MSALRKLALLSGSILLAGCNMVVSDEPWLTRGPDTPVMKPGIWVSEGKPDCEYDLATPVESWPECADPAIIRADGAFLTLNKETAKWRVNEVILGTDDPIVAQVALPEQITTTEADAPKYIYLAMRPTGQNAGGEITAIETWMMQCGPIDRVKVNSGDQNAMVTKEPFDGLTVVGSNCHADSIAALTNAASQSEALADSKGAARWVKEAGAVEVE
ncbi:hypothetical protein [Erythrobacter mangrovi]|uniref:Uncharacterized protein n=1 Tax=Erythrobacter mangrovi TaxID=2739433 RepID=A0A7D4BG58_9SPHN|nr:hypothetical protein [Erythrobacter mangrovi]QKG71182.1 hypothetical protein HQR01_07205 [Erythrobacter mangrovi]